MRQLKYLKLFEAFESVKLTKILGYINSESKQRFINTLEKLARSYDFPLSQFSDDMFEYLPFKKALNVKFEPKDEPCKMTSKTAFRQHGIEGEVCKSGKLARMWGERTRIVDCPHCGGSGKEPQQPEVKIIKFWFSSDGKFITQTGVDGVLRSVASKSKSLQKYKVVSTLLPDSNGVRTLRSLPHLTKVTISAHDRDPDVIATIFQSGGEVFCIQDRFDGGSPNGSAWRSYGRYSWNVSGGDFNRICVLKEKEEGDDDDDKDVIDPYEWNVGLNQYFKSYTGTNVESTIKDAHFALVLDLNKLKSGEYQRRSEIKDEREELKSGSRLVVSDDDVRKQNIERYLTQIALKADIIGDVSNIKNLVSRGVGGRWSMFVLESASRYQNYFGSISELYYDMMSTEDESNKEYCINQINNRIKDLYKRAADRTTRITKNLETVKKILKSDSEETENKYLPIVESLERISQKFYTRLMSGEFNTIEDLEIARQKMISLSNFFSNSTYGLDNLSNFIDYLGQDTGERACQYLRNWRVNDYYSKIIRGLQIVENLVTKI